MDKRNAAHYLQVKVETVVSAIEDGIQLPKSRKTIKLKAEIVNGSYEIETEELDNFISQFEEEEPGRHPPIDVIRILDVESGNKCSICRGDHPSQYHHIVEFSEIKHYDPQHMLAVCPTCHDKCTKGIIDRKTQYMYKEKLSNPGLIHPGFENALNPTYFVWDDLKEIISQLHTIFSENEVDIARFDFNHIDLSKKNRINNLSDEYYRSVILNHEPYFHKIDSFLKDPINIEIQTQYYEIIDAIRAKIALYRGNYEHFEEFMNAIVDLATEKELVDKGKNRRLYNLLVSFMYVNCDIGRKYD